VMKQVDAMLSPAADNGESQTVDAAPNF
jgi:hypothetical protein